MAKEVIMNHIQVASMVSYAGSLLMSIDAVHVTQIVPGVFNQFPKVNHLPAGVTYDQRTGWFRRG